MDEAWRELERAWARDPSPETLERVLRAREQAGLPLPARLLRAQRRDPRPLPETIFPIWFIPPGATYAEPCRGRPRQIPAHWVWGLRIEHSPGPGEGPHPSALQTLDALRPPGLELWESNTALLEALPGRGLRYLDLGPRTDWAPPGWRALAQLRELQVLVLASLQAPVTESALTALAGLPRLTALTLKGDLLRSSKLGALETRLQGLQGLTQLDLDHVTTGSGRDLEGLPALRHLEEFALHGPLTDADFARLGELPELRKVDLWRCSGLSAACLQHLQQAGLTELRVRDCSGIDVTPGGACPRCGGALGAPPSAPAAPISLPPTGGDYEWVETTSSWSLSCTQCPARFSGTSRSRTYL